MQSGSTPSVDDKFGSLATPDIADTELQLQQLVQQGVLTPEEAQAQLAGPSAMNGISTDPKLKQAQMDALLGLQDISSNGGMTLADKANLSKIQTDEDTSARGKRDAIIQNAQARGLGGSGLELMSQMQNQQDSATRQSQRDMDVAGQAQQRALEALMQGGQMAGNIQGQQFNQQAQQAQANDAISRFNAQNKQQVGMANTAANNAAQATNLAATQGIANSNVATNNQQQQYNKNLIQQKFNNEMAKRGGSSNVAQANAQAQGQNSQNQANATNQTVGAGISLVNPFLGAYANSQMKNQNQNGMKDGGLVGGDPTSFDSQPRVLQPGEFVVKKDDVPEMLKKAHTDKHGEFDAAGFLDAITGHKYGYKKGKKKNAV